MKRIVLIPILVFAAFLPASVFSQGREIKEVFSASTQSVEVGDSCFITALYVLDRGNGLASETVSACDSIYTFLKQNPSIRIAIISHSDSRPIPMTNDTLTARRANHLKKEI